MLTRRSFVHACGLTLALTTAPAWLRRAAAQSGGRRKILVVIFQRGAADALNVVVPFGERSYYKLRPSIAVPPPGRPNGGIDLDGRFALHPSLQPLKPLWDSGRLAIVHAVGSPDPSRSHFDAQEFMESGTPGVRTDDGWLNRALPLVSSATSPMRAIAVGTQLPRTLSGDRRAVVIDRISRFDIARGNLSVLEQLYASTDDTALRSRGQATFDAVRAIERLRQQPYTPADGAQYAGPFGQRLQHIAQLIKADVGLEVAFTDIGGWDHHGNETPQLTPLLREFGTSLAAFARDLGNRMDDVAIVTMSEFGRTAAENGTGGTDHGHGGVMMVLGGAITGGKIYGTWPGLEPEQLFEGRDLAITTDFRDVLAGLVQHHLAQDPTHVFPGYRALSVPGLLTNVSADSHMREVVHESPSLKAV